MARYYRRRYTRVVRPKKRWATNIKSLNDSKNNIGSSTAYSATVLVENSSQTAFVTPTPTVLKAGNFKVQADASYTTAGISHVDVRAYILFLPEGMTAASYADYDAIIKNHPEWIMGWKYASRDFAVGNATTDIQTFQFSSRLKRNLNSGDQIAFVCLVTSMDASGQNVNLNNLVVGGQAQYWTCAN